LRIFSAAPTKLQSNYRNAQQEIIFHHPARAPGQTMIARRGFSPPC